MCLDNHLSLHSLTHSTAKEGVKAELYNRTLTPPLPICLPLGLAAAAVDAAAAAAVAELPPAATTAVVVVGAVTVASVAVVALPPVPAVRP